MDKIEVALIILCVILIALAAIAIITPRSEIRFSGSDIGPASLYKFEIDGMPCVYIDRGYDGGLSCDWNKLPTQVQGK
jgi:hypothetical protein